MNYPRFPRVSVSPNSLMNKDDMNRNDVDQNLYLSDVFSQPQALRDVLRILDLSPLEPLARALRRGDFDRIVLTGMGASLYSAYPAWLYLAASGFPTVWVESAELLHYTPGLIGRRTLLWIVSQSGRSAEALALLEQARRSPPASLLLTVNDLESPLARSLPEGSKSTSLTYLLALNVEPEQAPSTRSYLVSLALNQLAALLLSGQSLEPHLSDLEQTIEGISEYLMDWKEHLASLGKAISDIPHIVLLGRGASLASAYTGALMLQEVGKFPATSMSAASFRHGPMEVISPELAVLVFAGGDQTRNLNQRLFRDLCEHGERTFWLEYLPSSEQITEPGVRINLPRSFGIGLPLAEIVSIQLLAAHLALNAGLVPGVFLHSGKVTLEE